jgi:hypothetical protein
MMKTKIKENITARPKRLTAAIALIATSGCFATQAQAYTFDPGDSDWRVNFDTSLQYTMGWRAEGRDNNISNSIPNAQSDYKFDRGDMVTNRLQTILEFQAVYQDKMGFRVSGSGWKDFAYDDKVETNPAPGYGVGYSDGRYSAYTKKYHLRGAELLDAFVFKNFEVSDVPVYAKLGRFTQQWGNALFFGFSSISYGQHAVDYIKGFTQPGSEVKELFLPRAQANLVAELTPTLTVSGQYFLENAENRFPEGSTYLAPSDLLYQGPDTSAFVFGPGFSAGKSHDLKNINNNFGVKAAWTPEWAHGTIGFYYRRLDETQPWALAEGQPGVGGDVHLSYGENVKLYGLSYETTVGNTSFGLEANYRENTALASSFTLPGFGLGPAQPYREGARGDIINVIANSFTQLGTTPLWDAGILLAEATYTHLDSVTKNKELFMGKGYSACNGGGVEQGCATKDAVAVAFLFEPQWLQVMPSIDLSLPISATYGIHGNPAYAAGSFYAEDSLVYSVGIRANYKQVHQVTLQYQDYYWDHLGTGAIGPGGEKGYVGGNGPFALNDKGWVSLSYKTSF